MKSNPAPFCGYPGPSENLLDIVIHHDGSCIISSLLTTPILNATIHGI